MSNAIEIVREECCSKCTEICDTCHVDKAIERIKAECKMATTHKGKWTHIDIRNYKAMCSECHVWSPVMGNYCPNCGADMRGEDDESTI